MANKFKKGDKVVKKGKTAPIMTVFGVKITSMTLENGYTASGLVYYCDWGKNEREEFLEDDLELQISLSNQ